MTRTYQNRHTGELFKWRWENKTHVGLVSLTDQREVKVKRSNLVKSWKAADDYRHVQDSLAHGSREFADDDLALAEPVRVGDKLPAPRVAPRPTGERPLDAPKFWDDTFIVTSAGGTVVPRITFDLTSSGNDRATTSEGEQPAPASFGWRDGLRGGGPGEATTRPSPSEDTFWTWPYLAAVVLAALFVVVMWIAVLS